MNIHDETKINNNKTIKSQRKMGQCLTASRMHGWSDRDKNELAYCSC